MNSGGQRYETVAGTANLGESKDPIDVAICDASSLVLALDVGGTRVSGGLVEYPGRILISSRRDTGGEPGTVDPGLDVVRSLASELLDCAKETGRSVDAVACGFPESVQGDRLRSREVLDRHEQPLTILQAMVGSAVPVRIGPDVRCAALAGARLGAGSSLSSMAYVSWGTGLSWTFVENGKSLTGERGEAIGFGELPVSTRVAPLWLGNLERFASGKGLGMRYSAESGREVAGAREILDRAVGGEKLAIDQIEQAAAAMGEALAMLVALVDPAVLVLVVGIGASRSLLSEGAVACYEIAAGRRNGIPPCLTVSLGERAGLIGAALYAEQCRRADVSKQ